MHLLGVMQDPYELRARLRTSIRAAPAYDADGGGVMDAGISPHRGASMPCVAAVSSFLRLETKPDGR